jgi:hypothetical protein
VGEITKVGGGPLRGLSDEQLQAIGLIAVEHSLVEFAAMMILAKLINPDMERGISLIGGDDLHLQLPRISRLVKQPRDDIDAPTLTAILEWVGEVDKIKGERSRVLHSVWVGGSDESGPTLRLRFRRGGKTDFGEMSHPEMLAIWAILNMLANQGFELLSRLGVSESEVEINEEDIDDDYE